MKAPAIEPGLSLYCLVQATLIEAASPRSHRTIGIGTDTDAPGPSYAATAFRGIPAADDGIAVRRGRTGLEGFQDRALRAGSGAHAGFEIDADQFDAGWNAERHRRFVGQRDLEEVFHDRRGQVPTGSAASKMPRLVVTHIDTDHDVRREADKPCILFIVSRTGLACNRLTDFLLEARPCRGAAQNHAFHH